ncbi:membrane protein insertion efficiency factor YidD [Kutzneria sp. CA-103260]|uniref:membrane protein insertion efficiency factor YidD n=1 Tax=Kutzneria sp. CA-103260 TaxID=2802641 RepID=UPI001BED69E0|nr:Putative membrane protein insertion efficiency factor [Kutzneria sp. CA-103260]
MPFIRRRRRYDDRYYEPRRYRGGGGSSCWRDACLIESGCCIAESCDGNCLILGLLTIPHLLVAVGSAVPRTRKPAEVMIAAIRVYQREISAKRPAVCRFEPSCSEYAAQASPATARCAGPG